ncbi:hypothetical protein SCLCIDRAFT_597466 [Scleroderma citrinum Foug A]|uniref:Uncharacterized protein n=1 Tax=Scleroderma citrinum Foug A TaxID=1036808 RepID=A0A0C2ZTJ6_9AGAM|nr:hypothetical protein SCLCIDRAFT_597466 [Scleroderma citrinum Foug A]
MSASMRHAGDRHHLESHVTMRTSYRQVRSNNLNQIFTRIPFPHSMLYPSTPLKYTSLVSSSRFVSGVSPRSSASTTNTSASSPFKHDTVHHWFSSALFAGTKNHQRVMINRMAVPTPSAPADPNLSTIDRPDNAPRKRETIAMILWSREMTRR